jgi:hypothetical protein
MRCNPAKVGKVTGPHELPTALVVVIELELAAATKLMVTPSAMSLGPVGSVQGYVAFAMARPTESVKPAEPPHIDVLNAGFTSSRPFTF